MAQRRLFGDDGQLNEEGLALDLEVRQALASVLERAKDAGYDQRDAGYIAFTAAFEAHLDVVLFHERRKV
jgi:hypothetical protein